ncbi:MAG: hypothetical protein IJ845_11485 [Bacteroidaceae bacterium]|nr:hypothetical protein [Bacteroidaceae bacterium]
MMTEEQLKAKEEELNAREKELDAREKELEEIGDSLDEFSKQLKEKQKVLVDYGKVLEERSGLLDELRTDYKDSIKKYNSAREELEESISLLQKLTQDLSLQQVALEAKFRAPSRGDA